MTFKKTPLLGLLLLSQFLLFIFMVWNTTNRQESFHDALIKQSEAIVRGSESQINVYLNSLKQRMKIYTDHTEEQLLELLLLQSRKEVSETFYLDAKRYFPELLGVSLADSDGKLLVDDVSGLVGRGCRANIQSFAKAPNQSYMSLHSHPGGYHFDVMTEWVSDSLFDSHVFFLSFSVGYLQQLLLLNEFSHHQLLLVNQDNLHEVALSSTSVRKTRQGESLLSDEDLKKVLAQQPVSQTLWSLLDVPDTDVVGNHARRLWIECLAYVLIYLLISMGLLRLLWSTQQRGREMITEMEELQILDEVVFNTVQESLLIVTQQEKIIQGNSSVTQLFGHAFSAMKNHPLEWLISGRCRQQYLRDIRPYIIGEKTSSDSVIVTIDILDHQGHDISVELTIYAVCLPDQQLSLCVLRDLRLQNSLESVELARQEKQMHAQKLEALGKMTAGVAHEFNNMLQPVMGFASMIHEQDSGKSGKYALLILKTTRRAAKLVRQMLDFSRKSFDEKKQPVYFSVLLGDTLDILQASMPENVQMTQHVDSTAKEACVLVDIGRAQQVLMNLFQNALQAMDQKGTLNISVEVVFVDEEKADDLNVETGSFVCFCLTDNGCGMDEEVQSRIFEPFFTTKPVGQGSGMGLSVVQGVVLKHGGAITVDSSLGDGTVFSIYWPKYDLPHDSIPEGVQTEEQCLPQGEGQHVVFIDDDLLVRTVVQDMLRKLNYQVTLFASPEMAIEWYKTHSSEVSLVITDYAMPDQNGLEMAECLQDIHAVPVILISGFRAVGSRRQQHQSGVVKILNKPVDVMELGKAVHANCVG
jgi:signal transduction histidine kinase